VTLDPGFDLYYQPGARLKDAYEELLSAGQMAACLDAQDVRGRAAEERIQSSAALRSITLAREEAEALFPRVAAPYWKDVTECFPELLDERVPPAVQTVFLSLAYNRGPRNDALEALRAPLGEGDWRALADRIGAMQDHHRLEGVTRRRDREAAFLRERAGEQARHQREKENVLAQGLRRLDAAREPEAPWTDDQLADATDVSTPVRPEGPPSGAPPPSLKHRKPMNAAEAEAKAESVSTLDEAHEVVDEWFDDPEDKEVVVEKLNAAIDVPGIPEEMEGVILSQMLGGIFYAAEHVLPS
jgi:GH24 family phage-related lysozyme (muramidase)